MSDTKLAGAELIDALDGLHAADVGAASSGIHDELLRARVIKELSAWGNKDRHRLIAKYVSSAFLSDKALEAGYGPKDAEIFLVWLDESMGLL